MCGVWTSKAQRKPCKFTVSHTSASCVRVCCQKIDTTNRMFANCDLRIVAPVTAPHHVESRPTETRRPRRRATDAPPPPYCYRAAAGGADAAKGRRAI